MENEEKEKSFYEIVLTIKNEIEKYDLKEWEKIVKPEDPRYDAYFNECLRKQRIEWERGEEKKEVNTTQKKKKVFELNKRYFETLSTTEKFYFFLNLKEKMETSWLLAYKRIKGIKAEEKSDPVNVDDVIAYAATLADTTCAPPDYDNIYDKALHLQFYPNYHFFNFVNIEEIHMSKLFQLQKYSTVCFPPIIYIKEKNNMLVIYISCTTPDATIYYKVNNDVSAKIYDSTNRPLIHKSSKVTIYAWSTKEGYIKSRVSSYTKTFKVKGVIEKDLLIEHVLTSKDALKTTDIYKENLEENKLDKNKEVFKNLGFLLNREREKKSKSSSSDSSSDEYEDEN